MRIQIQQDLANITEDAAKHALLRNTMDIVCPLFYHLAEVDKTINHSNSMTDEEIDEAGN